VSRWAADGATQDRMLFNSLEFLLFFPAVLALYAVAPRTIRWLVLLVASYAFYMAWRPEFILLIVASTIVDYIAGHRIAATEERGTRRLWLCVSLAVNLGLLFTFKYAGFVTGELNDLFELLGVSARVPETDLPLPVGISFYTFQTLSYTIDIFYRRGKVERHLGIFALYVAYFPQLVAGPIERSTSLLPELKKKVDFDWERITSGLRLALWGMFKKVVIADRLAVTVNLVYGAPGEYSGGTLALATVFFAFQIYCDFSGYSDIAIGISRVLGVRLMTNFERPYLAASIRDFWRRWHISLSTWFRDYLYIPLGGNRVRRARWMVVVMITFVVSGVWHGANWTFVVWGAIHGALLVVEGAFRKRSAAVEGEPKHAGTIGRLAGTAYTLAVVLLAWVFFRAENVTEAWQIVQRIVTFPGELIGAESAMAWFSEDLPRLGLAGDELVLACLLIVGLTVLQIARERRGRAIEQRDLPIWLRWGLDYAAIFGILVFGRFGENAFIYFQF
jgi:D-alanyl-lipoteichoic acid acyltransferase DltB (MBOAT superfamily)